MKHEEVSTAFKVALMVSTWGILSCAFKESLPEPTGSEDSVQATSPAPTPLTRSGNVRVSWGAQERLSASNIQLTIASNSNERNWGVSDLIPLPTEVPSMVQFAFSLNQNDFRSLTQIKVQSAANLSGAPWEDLTPQDASIDEQSTRVEFRFKLQGNQLNLPSDQESKLYLKVQLQDAAHQAQDQAILFLTTPPSRLRIRQRTIQEVEAERSSAFEETTKHLGSVGIRAHLLQLLEISSQSEFQVAMDLPIRIPAQLESHRTQINIQQQACDFTTSRTEREERLSDSIVLLPLEMSSSTQFYDLLQAINFTNLSNVIVNPGKTVLVGIYGIGGAVESISSKSYVRPSFAAVQAARGCRSRCGERRDPVHWGFLHVTAEYWQQRGWPGASERCASLKRSIELYNGGDFPDEEGINLCAQWELSLGLDPWDHNRFCQSPEPGNRDHLPAREYWVITKTRIPVQAGIEEGPISLRISNSQLNFTARYKLPNLQTEMLPTRPIPSGLQSETIQLQ